MNASAPRPIFVSGIGSIAEDFAPLREVFDGAVGAGSAGGRAVAERADRLADRLHAIEGPRVLVGHGLGAAVALETVLRHHGLVDGLVMISAGARLPFEEASDDFQERCDRLARAAFAAATDDDVAGRRSALIAAGEERLLADMACCADFDARDRLGAVDLPAMVVSAADDVLIPPWLGEELAAGLPLAHMVVVEGSGHLLPLERPAALSLLVAGYLARLEITLAGM